jgi:hypothetical protein
MMILGTNTIDWKSMSQAIFNFFIHGSKHYDQFTSNIR